MANFKGLLSSEQLSLLAEKIKNLLRLEFEEVHLSANLMNTIKVNQTAMGFEVDIPAEIYDLNYYYDKGVIVYNGKGSYAQAVNVDGGFSGTHKGYVEYSIMMAIKEWMKELQLNGGISVERVSEQ